MTTPSIQRLRLIGLLEKLPATLGPVATFSLDRDALTAPPNVAVVLDIDGEIFTFAHSEDPDFRHAVVVECRFGRPPPALADEAFGRLMGFNFEMCRVGPAVFSIEPSIGDVTYSYALEIAPASVTVLAQLLETMVALAMRWREDYFLDGATAPPVQAAQFDQRV